MLEFIYGWGILGINQCCLKPPANPYAQPLALPQHRLPFLPRQFLGKAVAWDTTNPMRAKSERLAAPQVLADNYPQSAHDKSMNRIFLYGQFLTTDHCSLSTGRDPHPPPPRPPAHP